MVRLALWSLCWSGYWSDVEIADMVEMLSLMGFHCSNNSRMYGIVRNFTYENAQVLSDYYRGNGIILWIDKRYLSMNNNCEMLSQEEIQY